MEDFDFEKFGEEFNAQLIMLEEAAKAIVPMFVAFRKNGLPAQEAAALTAAMISQTMPMIPQSPPED